MQPLLNASKYDVASCAHAVLDAVPPAIWFIRRQMRQHRKGLSLAQFRTLCAVERQPSISLSGLAEHLGASMPTASRIAAGLVTRGFLLRQGCDDDRRQLALALSPLGRSVLDSAWEATQKHMEEPMAKLSAEQRATVAEAMAIFRGVFGSAGLRELPAKRGRRTGEPLMRAKSGSAVGV